METDTKKRRGRPKSVQTLTAEATGLFSELTPRAAQNQVYAARVMMMNGGPGSFFWTERGKQRRQGIAEQIGRMLEADLITEDQAKELTQEAIDLYNKGWSVKQIAGLLREMRIKTR